MDWLIKNKKSLNFCLNEKIKIIEPHPFRRVGAKFIISGWIPESWLETGFGKDYRVFIDLIDIHGLAFKCTSIDIVLPEICFLENIKMLNFYGEVALDQFNASFVFQSQGRITIKLSGHKKDCQLYIPIIVKGGNRSLFPNIFFLFRHRKIGKIIAQYEKDLKDYHSALNKLEEKRKEKNSIDKETEKGYGPIRFLHVVDSMEIIGGLLGAIGGSRGFNKNYPLKHEDGEEKRLEKKYRKAIKWRGPLCGGIFGRMNGFEFNLYSNDHDKHFHVIHKGRGINARFSFPGIQLINYKQAKNSINSREKDKIIEYLRKPEIFKKLEEEFKKRKTLEAIKS